MMSRKSSFSEEAKIIAFVDIDSIQSQLAKSEPNKSVIATLWSGVETVGKLAGLADKVIKVGGYLATVLSQ